MRIKLRSGQTATLPEDSIVRQEKRIGTREVYYIVYCDEFSVQTTHPIPGYAIDVVDDLKEVKKQQPENPPAPPYNPPKLMSASEIPSAGGAMTASKKVDKHSGEKVKGETFFSHKSDSGLVIKSPQGQVIHETKVSDMYKRR